MSAVDDFIANLQAFRGTANSAPMIGDIDLFVAALQELSGGGGGGSPGGNNENIQFNDNGSFGGSDRLNWDGAEIIITGNDVITIGGGSFSMINNAGNTEEIIVQINDGQSIQFGFLAGSGILQVNTNGSTFEFAMAGGPLLFDGMSSMQITTGVEVFNLLVDDPNFIVTSTNTFIDAAGAQVGTITNAPTAGNPAKFIQINDNGTALAIPAWAT